MFQFLILLVYIFFVSAEHPDNVSVAVNTDERVECSGYISSIKLSLDNDGLGILSVIRMPDLPHELWTGKAHLRLPLVLAFLNHIKVVINSGNCFKEPWQFNTITLKKPGRYEEEPTPLHLPEIYESPCTGRINSLRVSFEGTGNAKKHKIYVQLDTEIAENYTRAGQLMRPLVEAFMKKAKIRLITNTCRSGDYGFGSVVILDRGENTS